MQVDKTADVRNPTTVTTVGLLLLYGVMQAAAYRHKSPLFYTVGPTQISENCAGSTHSRYC